MCRTALIISFLVLAANTASAGTFEPAPYLAEAEVEVLTKSVANELVARDLFGNPYATVIVGNVDVYDRFPFLEARYFQVVTDPGWDRLLLGEIGQELVAYDGMGSGFGPLASPRGMATDEQGRIFVADTGNDRILVFQTVSEFEHIELQPLFAITDLSRPYDVAYSNGGTPFSPEDDRLYVANTGQNEVQRYTLTSSNAQLTGAIGDLGDGVGRFAGPMAITVGRDEGVHTTDIYVADAHNGRLVHLSDDGNGLVWTSSLQHELGLVTSLDSDHWGNLFAAAPQSGGVTKLTADLFAVAHLVADIQRPRSFHVPFVNVHDHRTGELSRTGQGSGILVEQWGGETGLRLMNLGVELKDASLADEDGFAVRVTLTDHAEVDAEIIDPRNGEVIARHAAGFKPAGRQTIQFGEQDYLTSYPAGEYQLTIQARSTYDEDKVGELQMSVELDGGDGASLPARLTLLGNSPNPFNPSTTIHFSVPQGSSRPYSLRVYDARGRLVRELGTGRIEPGQHEVLWDGRDAGGSSVGSGIYLYRVVVGGEKLNGKMVLVK